SLYAVLRRCRSIIRRLCMTCVTLMSRALRGARVSLAVAALGLALAPAVAIAEPKPATIITGIVAHGPAQWPQYIAEEFGWLKQDNIALDYISVGGGGAQQLAGGSLNVVHSGYPDIARAALRGAATRIIINDVVAA